MSLQFPWATLYTAYKILQDCFENIIIWVLGPPNFCLNARIITFFFFCLLKKKGELSLFFEGISPLS